MELEGELRRARDSHRSTRTELERYQKLYTDELQLHKSLNDHLERSDQIIDSVYWSRVEISDHISAVIIFIRVVFFFFPPQNNLSAQRIKCYAAE